MASRSQLLQECAHDLDAIRSCSALCPGAPGSAGYAEKLWRTAAVAVVEELVRVFQAYPHSGLSGVVLTWNKVDQQFNVAFQSSPHATSLQDDAKIYRDMDRVQDAINRGLNQVWTTDKSQEEPFLLALFERLPSMFVASPEALLPMLHRVAGAEGMAVLRASLLEKGWFPKAHPGCLRVRL